MRAAHALGLRIRFDRAGARKTIFVCIVYRAACCHTGAHVLPRRSRTLAAVPCGKPRVLQDRTAFVARKCRTSGRNRLMSVWLHLLPSWCPVLACVACTQGFNRPVYGRIDTDASAHRTPGCTHHRTAFDMGYTFSSSSTFVCTRFTSWGCRAADSTLRRIEKLEDFATCRCGSQESRSPTWAIRCCVQSSIVKV